MNDFVKSELLQPQAGASRENLADLFKAGMRRLASGVALITTAVDGERAGLVATAVSSVSADPPTLLICINQSASAHKTISASGVVCVNLLSTADQDLVDAFCRPTRRSERFMTGDWVTLDTGAPMLASSLAAFSCHVCKEVTHGSHTIFLCEVLNVYNAEPPFDPLVYLNQSYRKIEAVAA
ncbi:flavin reductase family protein [Caballeronia sp. NCTM5]|uniref:flavin reductase family protein n=2 Tax=Caballeronia sp. NCTM5 TaxID=2921755 RepID=UPI0020278197|nr:flavin reductase family protein [Caballeronia sp. NCTM5]